MTEKKFHQPTWINVHPINPARCWVCGHFAAEGWVLKVSLTCSSGFTCAECYALATEDVECPDCHQCWPGGISECPMCGLTIEDIAERLVTQKEERP